MPLKQPVAENAIHRAGHQPFTHTVGSVLDQLAASRADYAFTRDDLEHLRYEKPARNVTGVK